MKLTKFKGLAHDLAHHLDFQSWCGEFKSLPSELDSNCLTGRKKIDKYCVKFIKQKLPKTFDFARIKEVNLKFKRSTKESTRSMYTTIKLVIKVDNTKFAYRCKSTVAFM